MPLPDPSLEPAVRDPRKLRNTALVLVGIMILGGTLIMLAYDKWSAGQAKDNRPAAVYRITPERDLRILRQDGETIDLIGDRKRVLAVNVTSLRDPGPARLAMDVMKRLAASRPGEADLELVTLIVDPPGAAGLLAELKQFASENDIEAPRWVVGSTEPKTLHKFIYNQLKADTSPHLVDGKWDYDGSIVLIDRNGNLRRAVVPQQRGGPPFVATFDFEQAAKWDEQAEETGKAKTGIDRNNVEQLEFLLNETIDKLLAEPPARGQGPVGRLVLPLIAVLLLGSTLLMIVFRQRKAAP